MEATHNKRKSTSRQYPSERKPASLLRRGKAAIANPPQDAPKRRKSLIFRGLKSQIAAAIPREAKLGALWIPVSKRRFWKNVNKTESCWLWTGAISHGYGQFSVNDVHILAHRYSYIIAKEVPPKGLHIHHICRTKKCVNPDHLEALTPAEHGKRHPRGRHA